MFKLLISIVLLAATTSFAAGITFGENGAKALSLGGAFAARADDLSAIQHNPSGLAQLEGFHFMLDASFLQHDVEFQRTDASGNNPAAVIAVRNTGGLFVLPNIAVGYGTSISDFPVTFAFGVYGPPAVGRYQFAAPNYEKTGASFVQNPIRYAPQRYALVRSDTVILYPTLSAAIAMHPNFRIGASLQYVYSRFGFSRVVTSRPATPNDIFSEDPDWDSLVKVNVTGKPKMTGILGAMFRASDSIQFGASIRPPVHLRASGKAQVELGPTPAAFATVSGERTDFKMTLPMEVKAGVNYSPLGPLSFTGEVVYERWSALRELVLTPKDITLETNVGTSTPVDEVRVPKNFRDTFGARLGGEFGTELGIAFRAGVLFEQSATPTEFTNIDFLHFTRAFITGGVGYSLGSVELIAAGAFLPSQERRVSGSQIVQTQTNPGVAGAVVGDGTYRSGGWLMTLGARGHFGDD